MTGVKGQVAGAAQGVDGLSGIIEATFGQGLTRAGQPCLPALLHGATGVGPFGMGLFAAAGGKRHGKQSSAGQGKMCFMVGDKVFSKR